MKKQIVYQDKAEGLTVRFPTMKDVEPMLNYINTLSNERTYTRSQGEQITLEHEKVYVKNLLEKMARKESLCLLAFHGKELIGVGGIAMQDRVEKHVGILGISLVKSARGIGLGSLLMELLEKEGKSYLPQMKIITLEVFSNNEVALNLYKKMGYIVYGVLPRGVLVKRRYVDRILMHKPVRK